MLLNIKLLIKYFACIFHNQHEKKSQKDQISCYDFISFLPNNWKVRPLTIEFFSYWIEFSFKRHVNSSFSDESTCLFPKEYAINFIIN